MNNEDSASSGAHLHGFLRDLTDQQRAGDTYGQLDRLTDEALLRPYLVSREQRREIPVACDVEAATQERIRSFYQAVAAGVERVANVMTNTVVDLSHEGFGWAVIIAGRLVVVSDVLRDAQRFGFDSLDAAAARGDALVAAAAKAVAAYPEAARDDS